MSARPTDLRGHDRHAHFAPEDLVELALEQSTGRVQTDLSSAKDHARARACPECSQGLDAALADLGRVRAALMALPSNDARRTATLAEATLALTTRDDASKSGEWRVVGRFVREGWRGSLALRCLAAGLLLLLIVSPVLAIVLALRVRSEQPAPVALAVPVVLPAQPAGEAPRELARESEVQTAGLFSMSLEQPLRSERLAQARRDLLEADAPKLSAFERQIGCSDDLAESVARMLIARSRRLGLSKNFDAVPPEPSAGSALGERALCAELLLDDWASSGRVDRRLSAALWQLPRKALGVAANVPDAGLPRAAGDGAELAGVSGDLARRPVQDRELFDALEQACASKLAVEPTGPLADWLAWGRGHAR